MESNRFLMDFNFFGAVKFHLLDLEPMFLGVTIPLWTKLHWGTQNNIFGAENDVLDTENITEIVFSVSKIVFSGPAVEGL